MTFPTQNFTDYQGTVSAAWLNAVDDVCANPKAWKQVWAGSATVLNISSYADEPTLFGVQYNGAFVVIVFNPESLDDADDCVVLAGIAVTTGTPPTIAKTQVILDQESQTVTVNNITYNLSTGAYISDVDIPITALWAYK
jgi:hypothetical protein